MLKRLYLLFSFIFFSTVWSQNTEIRKSTGELLDSSVTFCKGEKFDLKVNAQATSTENYQISKENPLNFPLTETSKKINFNNDKSTFSESIDIGFPFSFFGKTYTKLSVGINGRLVFNDNEVGHLIDFNNYRDKVLSGNTSAQPRVIIPSAEYNKVNIQNPNLEIPLAQIFFGFTDLSTNRSVSNFIYRFDNVNYSGIKGLLISFQNLIFYDYINGFNSSVLLLEDGRIIIYITNKNRSNLNAIIGLQNEAGNFAVIPPHSDSSNDYNNGNWKSENQAIVFTPNQKLTPIVNWFLNNNTTPFLVNNNTLNDFQPNDKDRLSVEISFKERPSEPPIRSKVIFNALAQVNLASTAGNSCGEGTKLNIQNPVTDKTYEWLLNGILIPQFTGTEYITTENGNYTARIKDCNSTLSNPISVNIPAGLTPLSFENEHQFFFCDNVDTKKFNLLNIINYPENPTLYTINFTDANGQSITNWEVNLHAGETKNYKVKIQQIDGTCVLERNFKISYQNFLSDNSTIDVPSLCFGTSVYNVSDFKKDFSQYNDFDIKFSVDGVNFNLDSVNPNSTSVKVKFSKNGFVCQSIVNLKFNILPEVIAQDISSEDLNLEQCTSRSQTFNLNELFNEKINPNATSITYFTSLQNAQNDINPITNPTEYRSGIGITELYARVKENNCVATNFPKISLLVYSRPKLRNKSINLTNCEGQNIFNLRQNLNDLFSNINSQIRPVLTYLDSNGNTLSDADVENYNATLYGLTPKIKIDYNTTCYDFVNFELNFYPKPKISNSNIPVCGESTYSLERFKNAVISNSNNYTFLAEDKTTILSSDIVLEALPFNFKFYIKDKNGCLSDLQSVIFSQGNPVSLLKTQYTVEKCDTDFDGKTTFNLDDYKVQFITNPNAIFEYFKNGIKISPQYTNLTALNEKITVRISVPNQCPTEAILELKINTPTKSSTLLDKYFICFGNSVSVDAGAKNISFSWSNGGTERVKTFTQAGTYSVSLTNTNGCTYIHKFIISDEKQPKIQQINQSTERIEVIANGLYAIEYSFDGGLSWQSSNILLHPTAEEYQIQVRSVLSNGSYCLGETKSIYNLKVHNVITPNGDGINDTWSIKNLEKMQDINITIVDRYGKSVFQSEDKTNLTWDGKHNNRLLPTASYWYIVKWFDPSTQKNEVRQGWILLKSRE